MTSLPSHPASCGGQPLYTPTFEPGAEVTHAAAPGSRGIVTAFMVRGTNRSYEVSWGLDKCLWHLEMELTEHVGELIGFQPEA